MIKENYRNVFLELGYSQKEIDEKYQNIVHQILFDEEEKFYFEEGDMAYVMDTGNHDVRTEGMSYAMMVFVQLDMKAHFDKIWTFARTYMYMETGINKGYFAWSVQPDGTKNSDGPAPDGEEYFAMALFFADHRWGSTTGIFNYAKEAKDLLRECIHKGENDGFGQPMWERENKLIKFVPGLDFSDPSYHLPHFYYLFSRWSYEEDRSFWKEAAEASRDYIVKACHPVTGLAAEYADYDGVPKFWHGHDVFYSDSYRVAANIGMYHEWFSDDERMCQCVSNLQKFFMETHQEDWDYIYQIDGTRVDEKILHPIGLIAANAMGSLATTGRNSTACVQKFWETPLRKGDRRYYDNFLYIFAFMALSGNYRIW